MRIYNENSTKARWKLGVIALHGGIWSYWRLYYTNGGYFNVQPVQNHKSPFRGLHSSTVLKQVSC